jgi:hypothetical protein
MLIDTKRPRIPRALVSSATPIRVSRRTARRADAIGALEGYRWLTEVLSVALDCYVWADSERPEFVDIVGPTRKFGGDNADAFYCFAPIDPRRAYRIRGRKGDAVYISVCIYGGPTDGRWSNRIVRAQRPPCDRADGSFGIAISRRATAGNWLTHADASAARATICSSRRVGEGDLAQATAPQLRAAARRHRAGGAISFHRGLHPRLLNI